LINEIDSASLRESLEAGGDVALLDIRSSAEFAQGTIPQAEPLPMHLLPLRLTELPRDRALVLFCRSGARSYHACQFLAQQGVDRVLNLRGGILAWVRQGLEIVMPVAAGVREVQD